jgi:hypothetical protein
LDYFGQAIPNANVKLVGADGTIQTQIAKPDGTASFSEVVGGDVQITAYLSENDDYYETTNVNVATPTTIQVQMGRYISLGGFVIQTSFFITLITTILATVVFLVFELYIRRRTKPKKTATVEKAVSK